MTTEHETRIHRNRGGDANSAAGLIAVYHARQGEVTWVLDEDGNRVAAIVPPETAEFVLANLPPRHGKWMQDRAGDAGLQPGSVPGRRAGVRPAGLPLRLPRLLAEGVPAGPGRRALRGAPALPQGTLKLARHGRQGDEDLRGS